ncbi:DUF6119 family protein [Phytohabitans flavus]|uniref:DUF6119 family protein n=1 Tax=Phytohabitans flavus TaxID=1076124 RepID=UPI00362E4AB4
MPALIVLGDVPQPAADWCPVIAGLTGDAVTVGYSSAGCALLVVVDGEVYALTYGTLGRFMINLDRVDPGFGITFATRAIEPDRIKRVTRRVLASTGRVDRNLVPGGQHIRRYGIEGWGRSSASSAESSTMSSSPSPAAPPGLCLSPQRTPYR